MRVDYMEFSKMTGFVRNTETARGRGNDGPASTAWRARGACNGVATDVFYPNSENEEDAVEAKAICGMCSVRDQCLDYALDNREHEGIWGGATERERRRILRQRRKTAAA